MDDTALTRLLNVLPRTGARYELSDIERAIVDAIPESDRLEYKADPGLFPDSSKLSPEQQLAAFVGKAVSAFANGGGGTLVLGVREVAGIPAQTDPPGVPVMIGRDRIDARIDRYLSLHVEPRPTCSIDFIDIGGGRAYVTVEVLPRGDTPHRIRDTADRRLNGRYYVRSGRESVEADHATLRTLFAEGEAREERVRSYLERQGFGDPLLMDPDQFGRRGSSRLLMNTPSLKAVLIITAIPEVLRGDLIDTDSAQIRSLLDPNRGQSSVWTQMRPTLEGRMAYETAGKPPLLRAYAHVHRTGYIEVGYGAVAVATDNGKVVYADVAAEIVEVAAELMTKVYALVPIRDRVRFAVHLRDVADTFLGLIEQGMTGYNTQRHLTLDVTLPQSDLATAKTYVLLDRRLANAYGIEEGLVLRPDGTRLPSRMFPLRPTR